MQNLGHTRHHGDPMLLATHGKASIDIQSRVIARLVSGPLRSTPAPSGTGRNHAAPWNHFDLVSHAAMEGTNRTCAVAGNAHMVKCRCLVSIRKRQSRHGRCVHLTFLSRQFAHAFVNLIDSCSDCMAESSAASSKSEDSVGSDCKGQDQTGSSLRVV